MARRSPAARSPVRTRVTSPGVFSSASTGSKRAEGKDKTEKGISHQAPGGDEGQGKKVKDSNKALGSKVTPNVWRRTKRVRDTSHVTGQVLEDKKKERNVVGTEGSTGTRAHEVGKGHTGQARAGKMDSDVTVANSKRLHESAGRSPSTIRDWNIKTHDITRIPRPVKSKGGTQRPLSQSTNSPTRTISPTAPPPAGRLRCAEARGSRRDDLSPSAGREPHPSLTTVATRENVGQGDRKNLGRINRLSLKTNATYAPHRSPKVSSFKEEPQAGHQKVAKSQEEGRSAVTLKSHSYDEPVPGATEEGLPAPRDNRKNADFKHHLMMLVNYQCWLSDMICGLGSELDLIVTEMENSVGVRYPDLTANSNLSSLCSEGSKLPCQDGNTFAEPHANEEVSCDTSHDSKPLGFLNQPGIESDIGGNNGILQAAGDSRFSDRRWDIMHGTNETSDYAEKLQTLEDAQSRDGCFLSGYGSVGNKTGGSTVEQKEGRGDGHYKDCHYLPNNGLFDTVEGAGGDRAGGERNVGPGSPADFTAQADWPPYATMPVSCELRESNEMSDRFGPKVGYAVLTVMIVVQLILQYWFTRK